MLDPFPRTLRRMEAGSISRGGNAPLAGLPPTANSAAVWAVTIPLRTTPHSSLELSKKLRVSPGGRLKAEKVMYCHLADSGVTETISRVSFLGLISKLMILVA